VQTSDFSPPALAKKAAAPGENFQLRQICENSKFNGNFTFHISKWKHYLYFNTSHKHFVLCLWQAYTVSMQIFTFSLIYSGFFADVQHYFEAQINAAGVEQTPAQAK
jgi:hypothetical protein